MQVVAAGLLVATLSVGGVALAVPGGQPRGTTLAQAGQAHVGLGAGVVPGERGQETSRRVGQEVAAARGQARGPVAAPKRLEDVDGCERAYGTAGQCLPVNPPADVSMPGMWHCVDVLRLFPAGLRVNGSDPLMLDADSDGLACGPND